MTKALNAPLARRNFYSGAPPAPGDPVWLDCPKPGCAVRFTLAAIVAAAPVKPTLAEIVDARYGTASAAPPPSVTCPSCRGAFVAPEGTERVKPRATKPTPKPRAQLKPTPRAAIVRRLI